VACFAVGFLVYTMLTKVAVAIMMGEFNRETVEAAERGQAI